MNSSSSSNPPPQSEKKVRKPYTITKSRESWTDEEHDKFLEALQLFDRDWKKIEDFVASKTVIQIRSHAQKYFLKVQKNGTAAHVPPPRPKRKATHPYPQKAHKNVLIPFHASVAYPSSTVSLAPQYPMWDGASMLVNNPSSGVVQSENEYNILRFEGTYRILCMLFCDDNKQRSETIYTCIKAQHVLYEIRAKNYTNQEFIRLIMTPNLVNSAEADDGPNMAATVSNCNTIDFASSDLSKQSKQDPALHGIPDFAEVYSFMGSVFDPESKDHIHKLKEMDPINFETVLLLMRNLTINLSNPDFEPMRNVLSSYDVGDKTVHVSADTVTSAD